MNIVHKLKEKVLQGERIEKKEALMLAGADLEELCKAADEIREAFCHNGSLHDNKWKERKMF